MIEREKLAFTIAGAVAGALAGPGILAVCERVKTGWWPWEHPEEETEESEETSHPLVEYRVDVPTTIVGDDSRLRRLEQLIEEKAVENAEESVGDSELAHKPNIFLIETEAPDGKLKAHLATQDEFMELPPEKQHAATWFAEDEILAGEDERLDELDPATVHGGIEDAIEALKEGFTSGVYVICKDGEGLEIVVSHGNYLEEFEANQAAIAEDISDEEGYSHPEAREVTFARTSRRR